MKIEVERQKVENGNSKAGKYSIKIGLGTYVGLSYLIYAIIDALR